MKKKSNIPTADARDEPAAGAEMGRCADLVVYEPSGKVVVRFPLSDKEIVIGRRPDQGPSPEIELTGPHVSRNHARIIPTASGHRIVDQNSTNGIKRGKVLVGSWDFRFGEEVLLGDYRLLYIKPGGDPNRTVRDTDIGDETRLRVDTESGEVWIGERQLHRPLSRLEFKLLSFLYARAGRICSRDEVGAAVWGAGNFEDMMVHQLVHRVREKLGDDREHPRYLINLPGQGYRLDT